MVSSVLCEKQQAAAEKVDDAEKKHDKRGIYDEGYGDFGGGGFGGYEEDHHHLHHHHEKTIVDVKKVSFATQFGIGPNIQIDFVNCRIKRYFSFNHFLSLKSIRYMFLCPIIKLSTFHMWKLSNIQVIILYSF